MRMQFTLIYWQSEICWFGKLLEHPEITARGKTLEELEENITDTYLAMVLDGVPDEYQAKTMQCEILPQEAGKNNRFGKIAQWAGKVKDASKKSVDTASSAIATGSAGLGKMRGLASSVADSARDTSKKVSDTASERVQIGSRKIADAASSVAGSVQDASQKASQATGAVAEHLRTNSKKLRDATNSVADALLETTQGLLSSSLSKDLNDLLQNMAKGGATIYDKAMDAGYAGTHLGGGNHRLFDGGHTIAGAFNAARGASSDDSIIQEAWGTIQGLLRDGTTPRGLPLATWDKSTFDQVAESLNSTFHIPKGWFSDLNTYDAAELLGSTIGIVSLALNWNRADTESFSRLVGSMGISASASMNPLLIVVTIVGLAKAFHKAHQTGEYAEFVDGHLKGALVSGATLGAVALVGTAGGPAGAGVLVGLTVGVLANRATKSVSVVQISQFVAEQATAAAAKAKEIAITQKHLWDTATARGLAVQQVLGRD